MSERSTAFSDTSLPERYERLLGPYLFEPWAAVLLDTVRVDPGARVIDIAAGTGVVSRAAARRAGPAGYVLSTDISPAMIAHNAGHPAAADAAPIETAVASATELGRDDGEFDVALCQQGMPFFPDRPGAVREMRRVLRDGGVVGIAVWTPGHDIVPFGPMNRTLQEVGAAEPFPGAYDERTFTLDPDEVAALLSGAGFHDIESREVELVTRWDSTDALVAAVHGTPFGHLLDGLDPAAQAHVRGRIAEHAAQWAQPDGSVAAPTFSVVARAVA